MSPKLSGLGDGRFRNFDGLASSISDSLMMHCYHPTLCVKRVHLLARY